MDLAEVAIEYYRLLLSPWLNEELAPVRKDLVLLAAENYSYHEEGTAAIKVFLAGGIKFAHQYW